MKDLQDYLAEYNIDGMYITNPTNIYYLTGFSGSFGVVILTKLSKILVTDHRYLEEAKAKCRDTEVYESRDKKWENIVESLKVIAYEANHMTVDRFQKLQTKFSNARWIPNGPIVEQMRRRKNAFEITAISKACAIGDSCLQEVVSTIKEGMTEQEVANKLLIAAYQHGAEGPSFTPIVAFGENSACPHHEANERKLQRGDAILIDFGVIYHNYCSDMTRTFFFQEISPEQEFAYNLVNRVQEASRNAMHIGATCAELHKNAEAMFEEHHMAKNFTHSLGHGVGSEVHEAPRVSKMSKEILEEWEAVTCEPGLYFPGKFGIRIEDLGVVKAAGYDVLTKSSKELRIL